MIHQHPTGHPRFRFRVWHLLAALTLASLLLTYWHLWGEDIVEDLRNFGPPRNPDPQVQQSLDRLDEVIRQGPRVQRTPMEWRELGQGSERGAVGPPPATKEGAR